MSYEINLCLSSLINSFLIYKNKGEIVYRGFYKKKYAHKGIYLSMFDEHSDLFRAYLREIISLGVQDTIGYIHKHAQNRGQYKIIRILDDNDIRLGSFDYFFDFNVLETFEQKLKEDTLKIRKERKE